MVIKCLSPRALSGVAARLQRVREEFKLWPRLRENRHCRLARDDHVGEGRAGRCGGGSGGVASHLSGRLQQRSSLGRSRLLDHVVEEAVPVLQQHVGLVILLDSPGSQNLQSGAVLPSNLFLINQSINHNCN